MRNIINPFTVLVLFLIASSSLSQSLFPLRTESNGEAPDKPFHVNHYRIEVSFDELKKQVNGRTSITLTPYSQDLSTVELDAEQLDIHAVSCAGKSLTWTASPKTISIHLDHPYSWRDSLTVSIEYSCTPKKGLYFVQPDSSRPGIPWQIWTQGEDMDNHFWFPCHDFPNDKSSSEVIATVQSSYSLVSNGKLVKVTDDKVHRTRTFHWRQDLQHASYLIMLAAGRYSILRDSADGTPLEYYVYPGTEADGRASYAETPAIMTFYNARIGVHFPWAKYAQVGIADFMFGGMENTSATTLMDEAAVLDSHSRIDESSASLIAHEMAHQWRGDLLTCKDWRHLWLNESFASYFDPLYMEFSKGKDEFDHLMYVDQQAGINTDKNFGRKPVVSVGSCGANIYPRGASILHMLRYVLGDSLFWHAIHHYAVKYQYQSVTTDDFKKAIEEATGQNLYWFFDEWLYGAGYPIYGVSYHFIDSSKTIALRVKQEQTIDSLTGVFKMPVDFEVTTPTNHFVRRVVLETIDTTLLIPCPEVPLMVQCDPENWILKELRFSKGRDEVKYQAEHARTAIGRFLALNELDWKHDTLDAVGIFAHLAVNDPFYIVRREAVRALGTITVKTDSMRVLKSNILVEASHDVKPSVRAEATFRLGKLGGDSAAVAAIHERLSDSSNAVLSAALFSVAEADSIHAAAQVEQFLTVRSHRNVIASAALHALALVDSNKAIATAWGLLHYGEHPWTRGTALNVLERFPSVHSELAQRLIPVLGEKLSGFRGAAIHAIAEYGGADVIPQLELYTSDKTLDVASEVADAITRIRERTAKQ